MKNEEKTHLGEENKIFWTENANMKALIFVHLSSGSVSRTYFMTETIYRSILNSLHDCTGKLNYLKT